MDQRPVQRQPRLAVAVTVTRSMPLRRLRHLDDRETPGSGRDRVINRICLTGAGGLGARRRLESPPSGVVRRTARHRPRHLAERRSFAGRAPANQRIHPPSGQPADPPAGLRRLHPRHGIRLRRPIRCVIATRGPVCRECGRGLRRSAPRYALPAAERAPPTHERGPCHAPVPPESPAFGARTHCRGARVSTPLPP